MHEKFTFLVDENDDGERVDTYLCEQIPELSRTRIQRAVHDGDVRMDGATVTKPSRKVRFGRQVELSLTPPRPLELAPEDIPVDIVYEDGDLAVINKDPGMVVHPSPGHESGTLVHALLSHCDNLSGIGGIMRPGIVHRLDKDTSGLLVVAKNDRTHLALSRQLMERTVDRIYFALVWGEMPERSGTIERPIGRSAQDRKKMAVVSSGGKKAVTSYYVLDTFEPFQYIKLKLGTGRTHQIRVHVSDIGHPVLGDPVYGGRRIRKGALSVKGIERAREALDLIDRQALHAGELSFFHPGREERVTFRSPLPDDFQRVLDALKDR